MSEGATRFYDGGPAHAPLGAGASLAGNDEALNALAQGAPCDAFAVLGPQRVGPGWRLRVLMPGAARVHVRHPGGGWMALAPGPLPGLFQMEAPSAPGSVLRV